MATSDKKQPHANKQDLYRLFARIAAAMANPHRLELLDLLAQGPRTVEELAREANLSIANASQHLQRLKRARLVIDERHGFYIRYRIADPLVTQLWLQIRTVAEQQLDQVALTLDAYRVHRHEFKRVSIDDLRARMEKGTAVLLDVRPSAEYAASHLPSAVSIPLEELERRLNELPRRRTIIAYCRGPYCVLADQAAEKLKRKGFRVARLEEGVHEWQQAGYPLAVAKS
ncbi:MAG: metalloregulator ArsR/SmtB family transcription factor [Chloroflexi bacterium]|nr:metalloregulator ArsR/SmtB family transcription factor [Chloroflexota bacterium]